MAVSAAISAGLFFLGWKLIPLHRLPDYPYVNFLPYLIMTSAVLVMAGLAWWRAEKPHLYTQLTHVFSLGLGLSVVAIWGQLEFGPSGVVGDSYFSCAIIAKYKEFKLNTDFTYKGLPGFYPSLYHFLLGKLAWITRAEPWTMLNTGMTLTAFFLPWGIFGMWKRLTGERTAFVFMLLSLFVARDEMLFKPFEVISLTIFLPWLLRFIWAGAGGLNKRETLWGGIIGGLLFMTYYYYLLLLVVFIPLRLLVEYREGGGFPSVKGLIGQYWRIFRWSALLSAVYWLPLLGVFLFRGFESFQNRWFQPYMITGPYADPGAWPVVAGLVLTAGLAMQYRLARGFVLVLVAQLLWLLLAYVGMLVDMPLLHIRMIGIESQLAWMSLGWGALLLADRVKVEEMDKVKVFVPLAIAALFSLYQARGLVQDKEHEMYKIAARSEMPALVWFPEFREKAKDAVFLTNRYDINAYRPLYHFIAHNAHFSHPAARFRERLKFLCLLSRSKNPDFVAMMLRRNRFDAVDYIILDEGEMRVYDDNFPHREAHREVVIRFAPEALQGRCFLQEPNFDEMQRVVDCGDPGTMSREELGLIGMYGDEGLLKRYGALPDRTMETAHQALREQPDDYNAWARETWEKLGQ